MEDIDIEILNVHEDYAEKMKKQKFTQLKIMKSYLKELRIGQKKIAQLAKLTLKKITIIT